MIREGQYGKALFFIHRGKVEIYKRKGSDREILCGIMEDGDFFGEGSLISRKRTTASCRAMTHCDLMLLTHVEFDIILKAYPDFATLVLTVSKRMQRERDGETDAMKAKQ